MKITFGGSSKICLYVILYWYVFITALLLSLTIVLFAELFSVKMVNTYANV